jgi:tRNA-dihydrouridine synthase
MKNGLMPPPPSLEERIGVVLKHLDFSVKWKGPRTGIFEMRRHYASYFKGYPDFKPFRNRLVQAETQGEVLEILSEVGEIYSKIMVPSL